jgi:hypothetical protein
VVVVAVGADATSGIGAGALVSGSNWRHGIFSAG